MLGDGRFGEAGRTVVIEAFLVGEELSVLGLTNGEELTLLPASQDHKRLGEGDTGPNTGGMGAYAPVTPATPALLQRIRDEVMLPALIELDRRGARFAGCLYAGIMVDPTGAPFVVEFNCRFGDPEAQVVLPMLEGGVTDALVRIAEGNAASPIPVRPGASVTTVLAARGYPDAPEKGAAISLPAELPEGVTVFHAGTTLDARGVLRVSGGRVLNVTAVAPTFAEAQAKSREGADAIAFDGKVWRRDIGWREAGRQWG
jgi:phosphoribosylamine--glycine ligase